MNLKGSSQKEKVELTMEQEMFFNFSSTKYDPGCLIQLLNKYVKLVLIKNTAFEGFVRSIDPITCSIILSVPKGDSYQTTLIPGHAILDVCEAATDLEPPSRTTHSVSGEQDTLERKVRLMQWFAVNMLSASEDNGSIVMGSVSILPPYTAMDIYADNAVVVNQIKKLVQQMPSGELPTPTPQTQTQHTAPQRDSCVNTLLYS